MNCKKCGAEALDDAKFCGQCGARLDGKKLCNGCQSVVDETFSYCPYCGSDLEVNDGKKAARAKALRAEKNRALWKKVLPITDKVGDFVGILGVLIAVIFVFLIGSVIEMGGIEEADNIYYFFSDAIEEMKQFEVIDPFFKGQTETALYIFIGIGIFVAVSAMVGVVTFGALAVITLVRNYLGKTEKRATKWSILAMLTYLIATASFYTLTILILGEETLTELDDATTAGVVLCSIMLGLTCICKMVARGKENLSRPAMMEYAFALGLIAFASVVFCLFKNSAFVCELEVIIQGRRFKTQAGSPHLLFTSGFIVGLDSSLSIFYDQPNNGFFLGTIMSMADSAHTKLIVFATLLQLVTIASLIFVGLGIYKSLRNVSEETSSSALVYWSVSLACAILALVLAILYGTTFTGFIEELVAFFVDYTTQNTSTLPYTIDYDVAYGRYIAIAIVTAGGFALSIVQTVLKRKCKKAEMAEIAEIAIAE